MDVCVSWWKFCIQPLSLRLDVTAAENPQSPSSPPTFLSSDPIHDSHRSSLQSMPVSSHPRVMAPHPYKLPARRRASHLSHGRWRREKPSQGRRHCRRRNSRRRIWLWRACWFSCSQVPAVSALGDEPAAPERLWGEAGRPRWRRSRWAKRRCTQRC